jgi:malate dehydrogenase
LGKNGIEKVIEMELNAEEKQMLEISANAVRDVVNVLGYQQV